ncbi:MAG TPA: hypothetical protein VMH20_10740 [Verrucomicrobiae bacterium]|nr:hypothetical protein [Verrucomicrobiae bacterium]
MRCSTWLPAILLIVFAAMTTAQEPQQNWTNYVRIAAYGLDPHRIPAIVADAESSHVFGIEVDNDIPGRYESFLDPAAKLAAITAMAQAAHRAGNRAFVYIAGTECITANADKSAHSVMKDHPNWVQRKITGEPAAFTSGAAFWIAPGDEDVWISPYAKEWRNIYMDRVRQIAATGIDGIYVDIPYWMTHFEGWEKSWASFDDATVAAFHEKTGLDAKTEIRIGDYQDPHFRQWIDFRINSMTDFMREIRATARTVNPAIMVVPEIYPGIEAEATVVGADVYEMYGVVDAIAHEYEFGSGEHMAASRSQLDWFLYQAGMLSFRAFAQGKATWILNYSWDGNQGIVPADAMKNLAMSIVMTGSNFWDARGHEMAESNDPAMRKQIFEWIAENEKTLYAPRKPMHPVGVYFSPKSRDNAPDQFLPSYRGALVALLQGHREFQVVTPRTLAAFRGKSLVLPNVSFAGPAELNDLRAFVERGGRLFVLGSGPDGLPAQIPATYLSDSTSAYYQALTADFLKASANLPAEFLQATFVANDMEIEAPPTMAVNLASVDGKPHLFIANFTGLVPGKVAVPSPVSGIRLHMPVATTRQLAYLPFLGKVQLLNGERKGNQLEFSLPPIERGAIVWAN